MGLKNSFLVVHQRGKVLFEKLENRTINTYTIQLKTTDLNSGVTNFTLFDNNGKPVCERLVYINNPNKEVSVNVSSNVDTPTTREKVTLQINLNDKKGDPITGNLSLSVSDLEVVGENAKSENIKTYLLLNSDIRGHIENPGYFFEKENDPKRQFLLDIVLLTHGWSRFTWNDLLYDSTAKKYRYEAEKGLYISGQTHALKEKGKHISAETRLTFMETKPYQELIKSDINGNFKFGPYVFYDSVPTLIESRIKGFKSNDNKNRDVNIVLQNTGYYSPKVSRNTILKLIDTDETVVTNFLKQSQDISKIDAEFSKNARLLDEVIVIAEKRTEREERRKALNERVNYGSPTHRLDLNDILNPESFNVFDLLNRLPGVRAINNTISIRNGGIPRVFIDGVEVTIEEVLFLSGADIEFIDVLSGADAAFFSGSGNGVIAIHTRIGSNFKSKNIKRKPGIIDFYADGFYTAREFYSPDHINSFEEAIKQDIRTVLYWEPKIKLTSDNTKAEVSFFTSDVESSYTIKIEGITDTGIPVYKLSILNVE